MRLYDGGRAEASFRRALALSPDSKEGWLGPGWALRMLGRFDEADACVKRLHELDPADLRAVRHVPSTGNQPREAADIERLAMVLDRANSSVEDRITAGFALGRLLDDAGRYDEAFPRYAAANDLRRRNWPAIGDRFDAAAFRRSVDALIATNTPQQLAETAGSAISPELPVFVVGMPRSGTTLVEQICASHSRVFAAGELDSIARMVGALARQQSPATKLSEAGRRAADAHVVHLHGLGRGTLRVVDKLPDNVLLVGLIARLLPRARIVYCSRDPRDISLSCYFQLFSDGAQFFSYDLADCGSRCRDVQRLAAHWLELLPLHMIEVNYETMVADLEGQSRRLMEFLGLDWEPGCLDFHRTERTVATLSHWQVRQPIYSSSIGRWRHCEKHLAPLFRNRRQLIWGRKHVRDSVRECHDRPGVRDAVAAYRAGRLAEAEALCQGILNRQLDHVASLQVLGAVAGQLGAPRPRSNCWRRSSRCSRVSLTAIQPRQAVAARGPNSGGGGRAQMAIEIAPESAAHITISASSILPRRCLRSVRLLQPGGRDQPDRLLPITIRPGAGAAGSMRRRPPRSAGSLPSPGLRRSARQARQSAFERRRDRAEALDCFRRAAAVKPGSTSP